MAEKPTKPPVTRGTHELPFHALSPREFERLCLWLVEAEGYTHVQHLGAAGSEQGRDILAKRGDTVVAFQCKRVRSFGPSDVLKEVKKVRKLPVEDQPDEYIFIVTCDVSAEARREAAGEWGDENTCLFCAGTELDARVNAHPRIVEHFFDLREQPAERAPFVGVPEPSQCFVGRGGDIAAIREILTKGDIAVSAAIAGMAGVGKTELVIQLAWRLAREQVFPGGIFWLPAEDPDLTPLWGSTVADTLGIGDGELADRAAQTIRLLSQVPEPVLLILDNVTEWTNDAQPAPLPAGTHITKVVTTRRDDLGGTRFRHWPVSVLATSAARELLTAISGRTLASAEEWDSLLAYLDGHALALALAGAYLRAYPEISPEGYRQLLIATPQVESEVATQTRYERTVDEALQAVWRQLSDDAQQAWLTAACFEPEPVSPMLSERARLTPPLRRELRRFHVLEEAGGGWWKMHRLTQSFGRRTGSPQGHARASHCFTYACQMRAVDMQIAPLESRLEFQRIKAHLDGALTSLEKDDGRVARFGVEVESRATSYASTLGRAYYVAGDLRRAAAFHETALEGGKEGGDDLAEIYSRLGDLQPERTLRHEILETHLARHGEHSNEAVDARIRLARVLARSGATGDAKEQLSQAEASARRTSHRRLALHLHNLASVYTDAEDWSRAKRLYIESLGLCDANEAWDTLGNLGCLHHDLEELTEAEARLREALSSAIDSEGETSEAVATCRSNLALVLRDLGVTHHARELLQSALATEDALFGEQHPKTLGTRINLGGTLRMADLLTESRTLLSDCLALALDTLTEHHPLIVSARNQLAATLKEMGELCSAENQVSLALEAEQARHGSETTTTAVLQSHLGEILAARGELTAAVARLEHASNLQLKLLGPDHPGRALALALLASLYGEQGDTQRATSFTAAALGCVAGQPPGSVLRQRVQSLTSSLG
ncbi:MAG: tetratricopeptide repeat protein [Acidobacteriota bacterium]